GDRKVASEIPGRAARQNHGPNIGIAGVTIQRRSYRVAHLRVEIDSLGAAQCNDCDSIGHARGQNVGGHGILLNYDRLCSSMASFMPPFLLKYCFSSLARAYPASVDPTKKNEHNK